MNRNSQEYEPQTSRNGLQIYYFGGSWALSLRIKVAALTFMIPKGLCLDLAVSTFDLLFF